MQNCPKTNYSQIICYRHEFLAVKTAYQKLTSKNKKYKNCTGNY